MKTDQELLREFVRSHAENAFAELVKRHIGLVYGTACRETNGDASAAQDITQLVFIELVRKAATLQGHPTLAGWLYTSVRFVSANARRAEQRRIHREEESHAMNELLHSNVADPAWEELKPVLDDAMHELNEDDRNAVLLRYFEGKNLREVGESLSLSENTARMRVDRALEKLQKLLAKRGVHSTNAVLTKTLSTGMVVASPAFIASVTSAALATATLPIAATTSTLFGMTTMAKLKLIGLGALAITAASVVTWEEHQRRSVISENALLRNQVEQAAPLREQNQRLLEEMRAAEKIRQSELSELMRFRAQAVLKRDSQGNPQRPDENDGPAAEGWRERFDELYKLRDGEVLRRVGMPFGPERERYYQTVFRGGPQANLPKNAPDYFVFREDASGKKIGKPTYGYAGGKPTLDHVLRYPLRLGRDKYYGADDLLGVKVDGDWIIREGASVEAVLAALQPILLKATGQNIRLEKQRVEEDVIVVRGSFSPEQGKHIDIFAEKKETAGGGSGDFQKFLDRLGDRLNIPFVNEVTLQNAAPIEWRYYTDARFDRGVGQPGVPATVLDNLSKQTGLQFELQRRPTEIWMVK